MSTEVIDLPDKPVTIDEALYRQAILRVIDKLGLTRIRKLTPVVLEGILESLRDGNYIETACSARGITKGTLYDWIEKGRRDPESLESDVLHAMKKAVAEGEELLLKAILTGKANEWQKFATMLSRRHADRWSDRQPLVNINIAHGLSVAAMLSEASKQPVPEGQPQIQPRPKLPVIHEESLLLPGFASDQGVNQGDTSEANEG